MKKLLGAAAVCKSPCGNCGGEIIRTRDMQYEVLGGGYTEHYHRAMAYELAYMTEDGKWRVLCILREMPDGSMQAIEHLYPDYGSAGRPVKTTQINVCTSYKLLKESVGKIRLGRMPNGPAMMQMGLDWERVFPGDRIERPSTYLMERYEQGKPVWYQGEILYLNGIGWSTENKDSIVRYIKEDIRPRERRIIRLEYTGCRYGSADKALDVEMYRTVAVMGDFKSKRVYARHLTIEEVMKSKRFEPMIGRIEYACDWFYGSHEL